MEMGLFAQNIIVAIAVVLSAVYLVRRQWPDAVRRMRGMVALWLMQDSRASWMRALGRRVAPAPRAAGGAACAVSCGGCGPSSGG